MWLILLHSHFTIFYALLPSLCYLFLYLSIINIKCHIVDQTVNILNGFSRSVTLIVTVWGTAQNESAVLKSGKIASMTDDYWLTVVHTGSRQISFGLDWWTSCAVHSEFNRHQCYGDICRPRRTNAQACSGLSALFWIVIKPLRYQKRHRWARVEATSCRNPLKTPY